MATYYVKNGGNDGADGLSDATAWASLGKVASVSLGGGDTVLFKRGSRWRDQFTYYNGGANATSRLVFGAYGTGTAPIHRWLRHRHRLDRGSQRRCFRWR